MAKKVIKQIIPAVGWSAIYRDGDPKAPLICVPLICWALTVDDDGEDAVVGMDGPDYALFCEENANFIEYRHNSESFGGRPVIGGREVTVRGGGD